MELTVRLKPIETFEATINGKKIGEFHVVSKWEGMIKLVGKDGKVIIVNDERNFIDHLFDGIFNEKEPKAFNIVSISPDLIPSTETK